MSRGGGIRCEEEHEASPYSCSNVNGGGTHCEGEHELWEIAPPPSLPLSELTDMIAKLAATHAFIKLGSYSLTGSLLEDEK